MKHLILAGLITATFAGIGAQAQNIEARKDTQQDRIAQGVKSGELTPAEAAKLEQKETKLNSEIRQDRKDGGKLTAKERAKIKRQQDQLSRKIARQKHDAQKRR